MSQTVNANRGPLEAVLAARDCDGVRAAIANGERANTDDRCG